MVKLSVLYQEVLALYLLYVEKLKDFAIFQKLFFRVVVYGSARVKKGHAAYDAAYAFGRWLARYGMDAVTGGGPGIMEAANRGNHDYWENRSVKRTISAGLSVDFPGEAPNRFTSMIFKAIDFGIRLTMFRILGNAFVIFDGGFGSLLEISDALQHVQLLRAKVLKVDPHLRLKLPIIYPLNPASLVGVIPPIICVGKIWRRLPLVIEDMVDAGMVDPQDGDLIHFVETWEQAATIISEHRRIWRKAMRKAGHEPRN